MLTAGTLWYLLIGVLAGTAGSGLLLLLLIAMAHARRHRSVAHRLSMLPDAAVAVREERSRIARELHDVVGHGLLVVAMQARHMSASEPDAAKTAEAIDRTARMTLDSLREVVGVLRTSDPDGIRADPGLSERLTEIIERLPPNEMRVELRTAGGDRPVPEPVAMAAVRIVQEGLANAYRHGPAEQALVRLSYGRELEIEVVSDSAAEGAVPWPGARHGGCRGGYGLTGLRERVLALHGEFESGAIADGFHVRACIPLAPKSEPRSGYEPVLAGREECVRSVS